MTEQLADPQAVLVVDETGDQYTGTAGRIENAQVAVYLSSAGRRGHSLIDRRLYPPKRWADDQARRAAAGIPEDTEFATKPELAAQMIGTALDAGVSASWVAGHEVYGADHALRKKLHDRQFGYATRLHSYSPSSTANLWPSGVRTVCCMSSDYGCEDALGGCDMRKRVRCDCGWSFEGEDGELIAAVQDHGRTAHGMDVTADQALAMAEPTD